MKLPQGFLYGQAELDIEQPVAYWRQMGVTLFDGRPLPEFPGTTSILVLAGWRGPAFIVTKNFRPCIAMPLDRVYDSISRANHRILLRWQNRFTDIVNLCGQSDFKRP